MGSTYQERMLATQRGTNDMRRQRRTPPQTVHPNQAWDFWAWASGGNKITIGQGEVQFGAHAAVAVAQTELTVNNDGDLLGLRYTIATHALEIVNFGTSITVNTTTFQRWLIIASLVGGVAGISRYGYFNPWINAYYAGTTP
jgi:hypothetical protein